MYMQEIEFTSTADGSHQKALFYVPGPKAKRPLPLVVGLHQWSVHLDERRNGPAYFSQCRKRGWAFIYPEFRGPNDRPQACASLLAVQDVIDAVDYAKSHAAIDEDRIYMVGASGGGMMSLIMAGRYPEIWAAVSVWVPIFDLKKWYADGMKRGNRYPSMLEACCGGAPGSSRGVDGQYRIRSPKSCIKNAANLSLDINAGVHDGHIGAVPIYHSFDAFNVLAKAAGFDEKIVGTADIKYMVTQEAIPPALRYKKRESFNRMHKVLFRRQAGKVRITIFEGGHEVDPTAAFEFFVGKKRSSRE
ncbi:MAG TPA: prolyl oligopeptidase family serine peptidase [Phycisphaerae bacterium]|nr:prolyl oligopeptidase family serine peptidase [Phycisphaerae bacterium]